MTTPEILCPECSIPISWQDDGEHLTLHGHRDADGAPRECKLSGAPTPCPTLPLHDLINRRAMLVYQAGIANVFRVASFNLADYGREARRLYQGDFDGAVSFARGLGAAGFTVRTAHCNQAGDVAGATWSEDLDAAPFSDRLVDLRIN